MLKKFIIKSWTLHDFYVSLILGIKYFQIHSLSNLPADPAKLLLCKPPLLPPPKVNDFMPISCKLSNGFFQTVHHQRFCIPPEYAR